MQLVVVWVNGVLADISFSGRTSINHAFYPVGDKLGKLRFVDSLATDLPDSYRGALSYPCFTAEGGYAGRACPQCLRKACRRAELPEQVNSPEADKYWIMSQP